jgi:two-component system cell cycle sensor histidine kinase/response regulator CckA
MNNQPVDKNWRVLVIDDNRAIHDDFRKILSSDDPTAAAYNASEAAVFGDRVGAVPQARFEVDSAYQGQEGVLKVSKALAAGRPYAMAFVDVRMPPGLDGVETTKRIWEIDPNLQIVLCTAYSDYSWGEMFEKLGRRDGLLILKKPFDAVEASQLAHALTEKWWLHQQSRLQMEKLEGRVDERTRELQQTNDALQREVAEHQQAEERLRWKTALLDAQVNSSLDGILIVDANRKMILQNQRFVDLFKMPPHIAEEGADQNRLQWVTDKVKNPEAFVEKVLHLYAHPNETSRDEIELKDGTSLDRYSSPTLGKDEKCYGRIWTFRDITARKRFEAQVFQSQKLETVAKLSGGIAHEFNSILTAVIGQGELLLCELPAGSSLAKHAIEIIHAGNSRSESSSCEHARNAPSSHGRRRQHADCGRPRPASGAGRRRAD